MAGYFEEMGWRQLEDGEQPNHRLHLARLLLDMDADNGVNLFEAMHSLAPPASKEVVEQLPEVAVETEDKSCPICLKKLPIGHKAKQLPCKHMFHSMCILTWLNKTNSCPVCRFELLTDDETYETIKKAKKRAEQRKEDIQTLHNSMFS